MANAQFVEASYQWRCKMHRSSRFLIVLLLACFMLASCATPDDSSTIKVLQDADGNTYAVSGDGKTFLFYYPGNESESFIVPDGIVTVVEDAFLGTSSLKELSFAPSVTTVLCDFSGSTIERIIIPETVETYNANFNGCTALKELTIYSASEDTEDLSINNSGITILTLPLSLTALSSPWFFDATCIQEIHTCNNTVELDVALEALCDKTFYMPTGLESFGIDQLVGLGVEAQESVCGVFFSDDLQTLNMARTLYGGGATYIISVPADTEIIGAEPNGTDTHGNSTYGGVVVIVRK